MQEAFAGAGHKLPDVPGGPLALGALMTFDAPVAFEDRRDPPPELRIVGDERDEAELATSA